MVLTTIRGATGEKTFGQLFTVYDYYPPEDLNDIYNWKECGINATSIDLEVMNNACFAAVCSGENAYKPLPLAGPGYMKGSMVEKLMRDAKLTQIFEGTKRINRIVSGRGVLTSKSTLF